MASSSGKTFFILISLMIFLHAIGSFPRTAFTDRKDIEPLILDAKSNALDTLKELKSLMQEVSDPELHARYTECTNYYNQVTNYLTQAEQSLKAEFFTDVARAASNALEMVESCEDQFEVPPSQPSSLEQLNNKEKDLCHTIFSIAGSPPSIV
ncbi:hypothetical protein SLA2020_330430 [Shorea laevis]